MPGRYYLCLLLGLTSLSCSRSEPTPAAAPEAPKASFTYAGKLEIRSPISFRNASRNAQSYSWDFGDGTSPSTDFQPTHTFRTAGTYPVRLTATGPGGTNDFTSYLVLTPSDTLAPVFAGLAGRYRFTKRVDGQNRTVSGFPPTATASVCDVPAEATRLEPGSNVLVLQLAGPNPKGTSGALSRMPPAAPYYLFSKQTGRYGGTTISFKAGTDSIAYEEYDGSLGGYWYTTYYGRRM